MIGGPPVESDATALVRCWCDLAANGCLRIERQRIGSCAGIEGRMAG